jgi:hypothetical protein
MTVRAGLQVDPAVWCVPAQAAIVPVRSGQPIRSGSVRGPRI